MKRFILFFCFVFLFTSLLKADQNQYQRIVSLAPSVTEVLYAEGAGDRVVGVTTYCEYPPEAKKKPKIGGFTEHNIEAIVALKPDLVILAPNRGSKFTYEKLKQLHIASLVVPFDNLNDLIQAFTLIGDKIGLHDEALKAQTPLLEMVQQIQVNPSNVHKKVLFINWHTPLIIAGAHSLEDDLIQLSGGINLASKSHDRYPQWNIEAFFDYDPDMIIDASSHGEGTTLKAQRKSVREFWMPYKNLRAVKEGNIYIFKENVYSIAGPRTVKLVKAIDAMMKSKPDEENPYYERVQI